MTHSVSISQKPTNDPKDSQDIWCKNDQQVDESEQNEGDGDVPGPVEGLVGENHLLDRSPHLNRKTVTLCYREVMEKSQVLDVLLRERAQWAR